MAVNGIRDGETLPHTDLQAMFGFKHVRNLKDFIADFDIPYTRVGNVWWLAAEDIRQAMRHRAKPHADYQEEREARAVEREEPRRRQAK